jgi:hypothetical protein
VDKSDNGINKPIDYDNHLMDAMRYAFYDVTFFHPQDPAVRQRPTADDYYNKYHGIRAEDMIGGWGL